jgi:hypothetical protein
MKSTSHDSRPTHDVYSHSLVSTGVVRSTMLRAGLSAPSILVTLGREMKRSRAERGLATLCVGGGQGQSAVIRDSANGSAS